MLIAALVTVLVVIPAVGILLAALGFGRAIVYFLLGSLALAAYCVFFWGFMKLMSFMAEILLFPIMRILCKGRVPVKHQRAQS